MILAIWLLVKDGQIIFEEPYRSLREEPILPPSQIHPEDPFIWRAGDG